MNREDIRTWRLGKVIILFLLVSTLVALPGQSARLALAQPGSQLMFVENVGQFSGDQEIRFQANVGRATLRLAENAIWLTVIESPALDLFTQPDTSSADLMPAKEPRQGVNLKLSFVEVNSQPHLEPFDRLDTRVSYFTGNDPANWQPDVPVWGGVRYVDLYPGMDLEITSESGRLVQRLIVHESDAIAAQSSTVGQEVRLKIEGADAVTVDDAGQLRLSTAIGELTLPLWQVLTDDNRLLTFSTGQTAVNAAGEITAPFASSVDQEAGISRQVPAVTATGASDLLYSTLLGGEGDFDNGLGIAIDREGYAYVTGEATAGFPATPGAFDTSLDGEFNDVFVAKLSPDGSELIYATFIGGNNWEIGYGIQVDEAGVTTIAGHTTSTDFPTTPGAFDNTMDDMTDVYVVRLNATGTALVYSTFLGGSSTDSAWDLDIDGAGYAYVAGSTNSDDFPVTAGAFDDNYDSGEAYAVRLSPDGSELSYATYLGGSSVDSGYSIAVDVDGNAYVSGWTDSADFPTTPNAFDAVFSQIEGFVVKLTPDGSDLVYGTFIGGSEFENVEAIEVDEVGYAYLTGRTRSPDFPTTPDAFAPTCSDCSSIIWLPDAFVTKLAADGSALVYSSFLGGDQPDYGLDIAVSEAGSAYVTGYTYSPDFPSSPDAFDPICESCGDEPINHADAFIARINPAGTAIAYATFLGGNGIADRGTALAVDNDGNVYVTGSTDASDFPVTEDAFDQIVEGYYDVFVTKLATGSDEPELEPTPTPTPAPTPVPVHDCGPTPLGEITVGDIPRGIGVDPARNRVYTANYGSDSVSVIDSITNSVLQTIDNIPSANGLAYDPTNNIIWVSNYDLNLLTPIQADEDAASFRVLPAISIGNGPWGVAYEPVHNYVYVANSLDNSVSVVDAAAQTVIATIADSFNQPFHLTANTRNGKIYVANFGHNSVSIVEGTAVSGVVQLWDSGRPYGIAVDEMRDVVYVATIHTHRIVAIGPLHGQLDQFLGWAAFQRGYNPNRPVPLRAIAVNPNIGSPFDGGHVWATTATVDGSEANQALFIPKGWSSYFHVPFANDVDVNPTEGLAVDRVNNRVYVTAGTTPGEVTVIGDHANICPGVAPAALSDDTEQISIDVVSIAELTRSDVTGDGRINIFDLAFIAARFGGGDPEADITGDGLVDIFDLGIVASNYGRQTPWLNLE